LRVQLFTIPERTLAPYQIGVFNASDEDAGDTAKLKFSILNGNEGGLFQMNTVSLANAEQEVHHPSILYDAVLHVLYDCMCVAIFNASIMRYWSATVSCVQIVVAPSFPKGSRGFDYNLQRVHSLEIQATDPRGLSCTFWVEVEVLDVNDPPIMLPTPLEVPENAQVLTTALHVRQRTGAHAVTCFDPFLGSLLLRR
jgi:hypothetical protein